MADVATTGAETPTQLKARLRREKMQKKMAEQGGDRLAKIKALNGGVAPPDEVLGGPTALPKAVTVEDPDEVDIETISRSDTPRMNLRANNSTDDPFTSAFLQMQQRQAQQGGGAGANEEDPMVRMMQQLQSMMGGNPGNPNDPNQPPEIPAMLQSMLNGGLGGGQKAPEPKSTYLWRITHAIFAFTLAVYVAATSTFNGTKLARAAGVFTDSADLGLGPRLFWIFATAEVLLQSTRYFLEKGQLQGSGILAKIANSGFVPPPYDQYVRTLGRYVSIFQTIVADVMVIIFTLGALAWWRGVGIA